YAFGGLPNFERHVDGDLLTDADLNLRPHGLLKAWRFRSQRVGPWDEEGQQEISIAVGLGNRAHTRIGVRRFHGRADDQATGRIRNAAQDCTTRFLAAHWKDKECGED